MARPLRVHIPGTLYHVMSRGNAKAQIFIEDADYTHFIGLVARTVARFRVSCRAFCLMPNHFHLLLEPTTLPVSRMMQQLNSAYSQFFNRRCRRVGHVLQGRFKAVLVDQDQYFRQVLRYIVLNPVKAGLVRDPAAWPWSSYRDTAGMERRHAFLSLDSVWKTFDSGCDVRAQEQFVRFVTAAQEIIEPEDSLIFGSATFAQRIGAAIEHHKEDQDLLYAERYVARPTLQEILVQSSTSPGVDESICQAFFRHAYTLREIGDFVGLHPGTVWKRISQSTARRPTAAGRRTGRRSQSKIEI
jgi:REP element-mobilizing transposase RayT